MLDPNNTATGLGGAVVTNLDSNAFGAYVAVTKASSPSFVGNYAFGISADNSSGELDYLGSILPVASGSTSGVVNVNELFTSGQLAGVSFSGTFTAGTTDTDRYTATLNLAGAANPVDLAGYVTADGHLMVVETDTNQLASGFIEHQQ
jgi:hypothetical protein